MKLVDSRLDSFVLKKNRTPLYLSTVPTVYTLHVITTITAQGLFCCLKLSLTGWLPPVLQVGTSRMDVVMDVVFVVSGSFQ